MSRSINSQPKNKRGEYVNFGISWLLDHGKTHLSIALGMEACSRGIPVKFFRTSALVNRLAEAKRFGELSSFMEKLSKAELLIFDQ